MFTKRSTFGILSLFIALVLTFSVLGVTPADAIAGIVVNSNADVIADDGFCTLREAITNANGDSQLYATAGECSAGSGADTITFAANYTITLVGSQLPAVTTAITINGNGEANTILQASTCNPTAIPSENCTHDYRVFEVGAAGNLTLNSLTVRNGRCNGSCATNALSGGGVYNAGTLNASNVTFSANSAIYGGGMFNYSSNTTLTNVTFSANSATYDGGGMVNYSSSPMLMNVTFNANAAGHGGGGMYNINNSSPTLTNVTFSANSATTSAGGGWGMGGGMYNDWSSPTLTNVTFSANSAGGMGGMGGGMYNNNSSSPTLTNATFSANSASNYGGGMINFSSSPTLMNVTFSANSAYSGGGMYNYFSSSPTLTNVTFSANSATSGGGMFNFQYSSPTLTNTIIANSVSGGDCVNDTSTLNAQNSLIEDGLACINGTNTNNLTGDPMLGVLANNGGFTQTFALLAGSPAINAGTNTGCPAIDQRGATRPQGSQCDIGAFEFIPPPIFVTNTNDSGSGSLRQAITSAIDGNTITFSPSLSGQTILLASTLTVNKNIAIDGSGLSSRIAVSGNDAVRILYIGAGKNVTVKNIILKNGKLTGTSYTESGAAIYVNGQSSTDLTNLSLQNITFSNNSAYEAGAIFICDANVTILDSEFTNNTSQSDASAIYVISSGNLTLKNSKFLHNTAAFSGAVNFRGSTNSLIENNLFEGNSAGNGGAIATSGGGTTLVIRKNLFKENSSTYSFGAGGALDLNASSPSLFTIENNTFYGNTAVGVGGAIGFDGATTVALMNNTFSNNGKYNLYISVVSSFTMYNNIIANSTAGNDCVSFGSLIITGGNNLVEDGSAICKPSITGDPNLDPLADNGGFTQTLGLPITSSAVNTANDDYCPATDQRGVVRPQEIHCDIGAFELNDTPPSILSITRANASPTSASNVDFTVTFSESVTGVDATDFALTTDVSGAAVSGVSGSGSIYTVTVNTGSGDGTIRLDVVDDDSIVDISSTPLNGGFTDGEIYTIIKEYTLAITSAHGIVAKNPDKTIYHEGDVVQLTATPDVGWSFANWTGGLISSINPDSVTIHGNTSVTANYTFDNQPPTNIALSNNSLPEYQIAGTTVGTLNSTDANAGDTFTYSLASGAGSTDNVAFMISGYALKTAYPFNAAVKNSYSIRVRTTDQSGLYFEKNFMITVTNLPAIFVDVPDSYWAVISVERLYLAGITSGCSVVPLDYCPTTPVTRAQMAIFLLRGMYGSTYTPPAATGTIFNDVPLGTFGSAWIEQLVAEGITSGCGDGNYCPNTPVSRAQMAIFLVRAKHGIAFTPPTATGLFTDVPVGSFGADHIEQLSADAITSGCGGTNFCPNTTVKRDSMAVFLVKTFNLP